MDVVNHWVDLFLAGDAATRAVLAGQLGFQALGLAVSLWRGVPASWRTVLFVGATLGAGFAALAPAARAARRAEKEVRHAEILAEALARRLGLSHTSTFGNRP